MKHKKEAYLHVLYQLLPAQLNRDEIVRELSLHIDDAVEDLLRQGFTQKEAMLHTLAKLGEPKAVALRYYEWERSSPERSGTALILLNTLFFLVGVGMFVAQAYLPLHQQQAFWHLVTTHREALLVGYSCFWLGCGYILGKRYGFSLRKSLRKLIHRPLLLNYALMLLVLFRIVPSEWFGPILTNDYVFLCVITTLCLSSLFALGYRFGIRSIRME
jgi:hypothetical protein